MECDTSVLTGHVLELCLGESNTHGLGLSSKSYLRQGVANSFSVSSLTCVHSGASTCKLRPSLSLLSKLISYLTSPPLLALLEGTDRFFLSFFFFFFLSF